MLAKMWSEVLIVAAVIGAAATGAEEEAPSASIEVAMKVVQIIALASMDVPGTASEVANTAVELPPATVEVPAANVGSIHVERGRVQKGEGALSIFPKYPALRLLDSTPASHQR